MKIMKYLKSTFMPVRGKQHVSKKNNAYDRLLWQTCVCTQIRDFLGSCLGPTRVTSKKYNFASGEQICLIFCQQTVQIRVFKTVSQIFDKFGRSREIALEVTKRR